MCACGDQVFQLAEELEHVILQLQESQRSQDEGRRDHESALEDLRAQLGEVRLERDNLQEQSEVAEKMSRGHQLELTQLQEAVSHMKAQVPTYEGTIRSLRSQVCCIACVCGVCGMCVCVHVCMHACVHVFICICTCVHVFICMCACIHVHVYMHACVHVFMCMCTCVHALCGGSFVAVLEVSHVVLYITKVEVLELSLRDGGTESRALAAKLSLSEEGCGVLREELSSARSEITRLLHSSDLSKAACARHRDEMARLQRRVEELGRSEEEVEGLRRQVAMMEGQLGELQAKVMAWKRRRRRGTGGKGVSEQGWEGGE